MKSFILILTLIFASACSYHLRVFSDQDPDYDLTLYKTFDWGQKVNIEEGKNPLVYNELNDKRIKVAIQHEMTQRGYNLSSNDPDFIVHYHIIIEDKSVVATEPYGYLYGPYWMRINTDVYSYREGTLIVDLMDRKTKHLVWRGWAVSDVDEIEPDHVDDIIKVTIAKIFKKYPLSPGHARMQKAVSSK